MATLCTKCAAAASILALSSPAIPNQGENPYPEFSLATGYIRREVRGSQVHAVDWDHAPGVETILRENGPKSAGFWRQWREWRASFPNANLEAHGNRVCELLLRHFGPYDKKTSEALAQRRKLHQQRATAVQSLNTACPPYLRSAAWEYLGGPVAPLSLEPPTLAGNGTTDAVEALSMPASMPFSGDFGGLLTGDRSTGVLSRGELILLAHAAGNPALNWPHRNSLEDVAKTVLASAQPLEKVVDDLDRALINTPLPAIPGEDSPADPDCIPYGRLICRHRAVIAAIPLALAGFKVELVNGWHEAAGTQEPHLFIYCRGVGVLEASSNGPTFWMKAKRSQEEPTAAALEMEDGSVYRFHCRTQL